MNKSESYDMTGFSVYIDYTEWRAVYTALLMEYNAHQIV
jgi:hypothetical protein